MNSNSAFDKAVASSSRPILSADESKSKSRNASNIEVKARWRTKSASDEVI